jgi:hypothetical protein
VLLLRAGRSGLRRDYVLYALTCAAGVYTHLTMAFVVAGHVAVVLVGYAVGWVPARERPLGPLMLAWAAGTLIAVAFYVPFIPGLMALVGEERPRQAAEVATASWALAEAVRSVLSTNGIGVLLAGAFIAMIGGLSLLIRHPFPVALLLAPTVVTAAAIVGLGQPLRPRFFFFLSGVAALFLGRGIGVIAERLGAARDTAVARSSLRVVLLATPLLVASVWALLENYRVPKQDFDGAVRFLTGEEQQGATIAATGPACLPLEIYYDKASWTCLTSLEELEARRRSGDRLLVMYTLADYIEDPRIAPALRADCPVRQRFPGTLGGGDIVVCDASLQVEARP